MKRLVCEPAGSHLPGGAASAVRNEHDLQRAREIPIKVVMFVGKLDLTAFFLEGGKVMVLIEGRNYFIGCEEVPETSGGDTGGAPPAHQSAFGPDDPYMPL